MGRSPCCEKVHMNKGAWTKEEDHLLINYIHKHGEGCWRSLPRAAGLQRCGKSCRLRWMNYLRPDLKRGNFTEDEDELIIKLHSLFGNKWSLIAGRLQGRTDNEIKNYWNTHIKRKLLSRGIDPNTHHLILPPLSSLQKDTIKPLNLDFDKPVKPEPVREDIGFSYNNRSVSSETTSEKDFGNENDWVDLNLELSVGPGKSYRYESTRKVTIDTTAESIKWLGSEMFGTQSDEVCLCCRIGLFCNEACRNCQGSDVRTMREKTKIRNISVSKRTLERMTTTKKKKTVTTIGHSIPLDLIIEILLRLPAKSVFRFRSVSKSWCSIIDSKQFTDAFMSLSLSRPPHLVLAFSKRGEDRLFFFSSPHQNCSFGSSSSSSSMLVAEKKNILMVPEFKSYCLYRSNSIRGFVCFGFDDPFVVCNPTTRQVIYMPPAPNSDYDDCAMYLGYDPNGDQYKVLRLVNSPYHSGIEHSVCTLGAQGSSSYTWRPIKTNLPDYECYQNGVCIDGVVYYECPGMQNHPNALGSFDVGSEQLCLIEIPKDLIEIPEDYEVCLTNYLGKLGVYCSDRNGFILCVLEDAKNQVWSKKTGVFPSFTSSMLFMFCFAGITATREIVYLPLRVSHSFELCCYDMEKKMERRVRVQGISEYHGFCSSLLCSYVENIATI